ncbi:hypothetical protein D0Y65_003200 [Glycine soja]|uniref:RNase H type-1 domain-containing protein n=1 Tax=Glycine soja TaxID=3848 RepID=A0A445LKI8_GLYSO|nr:hypothetical protein D0Y65_003200 [Glycine soja]
MVLFFLRKLCWNSPPCFQCQFMRILTKLAGDLHGEIQLKQGESILLLGILCPLPTKARRIHLLKVRSSSGLEETYWIMPKEGPVALNCDASMVQFGEVMDCGGVIHNHAGSSVCDFQAQLRGDSILYGKLKAILHGIKLAKAIKALEGNCDHLHPHYQSIQEIHLVHGRSEGVT